MQKQHMHGRSPAMRRRCLTTAIGAALAFAIAGPALAQDVAAQATGDEAQASAQAAAGDAAKSDPVTLDEVVVTANKRKENIREVATSVSVISERQLENMNSTQLSDYSSYVPGLQLQSGGTPGQTQVSMRGIGSALSPGSTVGTYIDETPIGSNNLYQQATLYTLDLLPYDVQRVEVLRGPQGTLYGAGAKVAWYPQIGSEPLPSDYILRQLGMPVFHLLFQTMIFSALLESGTAAVHATNERVAAAWRTHRAGELPTAWRFAIAAALLVGSIFIADRFGLVALIARGYRALAWLFLVVYIVPLLTVGVWRLRRHTSRPLATSHP